MRVFHGSPQALGILKPSPRGSFGSGVYFVASEQEAAAYGECIHVAEVELKNPWRINATWDSELVETYDFDSQSINAVLSLPSGASFLAKAMGSDGLYGKDFTDHLCSLGFDGVVATYPDGSKEIVLFSEVPVKEILDFDQKRKISCRI